jgi:hypothetical protein
MVAVLATLIPSAKALRQPARVMRPMQPEWELARDADPLK